MSLTQAEYIPLTDQFLQHWSAVENALGYALVLEDGTTRDSLQDGQTALAAALQVALAAENRRQEGINQRDRARGVVLPIAQQLRQSILGLIPSSDQARALPKRIPALNTDVQTQLRALRDVELIWQEVNSLPAGSYPSVIRPFTVRVKRGASEEAVALGRYSAAVAELDASAHAVAIALQDFTQAQRESKSAVAALKAIFLAYRKAVRGLFPRTSTLYQSLP